MSVDSDKKARRHASSFSAFTVGHDPQDRGHALGSRRLPAAGDLGTRRGAYVRRPHPEGALGRCAHLSESLGTLDRALNRELWPLGYVALIETAATDDSIAHVVIAGGR